MISLSARFYNQEEYDYTRFSKIMMFNEILGKDERFAKLGYKKANGIIFQIEKGCYDRCFGGIKITENNEALYHSICYNIAYNLDRDNETSLPNRIYDRTISPYNLGFMDCSELCPENYAELKELVQQRLDAKINVKTSTMYKCGRCGEMKCKYEHVQLRAIDEEVNVRVICLHCGNSWIS